MIISHRNGITEPGITANGCVAGSSCARSKRPSQTLMCLYSQGK